MSQEPRIETRVNEDEVVRGLRALFSRWADRGRVHPDTPGLDRETGVQVAYAASGGPELMLSFVTGDRIQVDVQMNRERVRDARYVFGQCRKVQEALEKERRRRSGAQDAFVEEKPLPSQLKKQLADVGISPREFKAWAEEPVEDVKLA